MKRQIDNPIGKFKRVKDPELIKNLPRMSARAYGSI